MDDITARKHGGNPQSIQANRKADKLHDRSYIVEFLKKHGIGFSKQIAREMGKPLNALSGRFSELLRDGVIERTGALAEGCAVVRLKGNSARLTPISRPVRPREDDTFSNIDSDF